MRLSLSRISFTLFAFCAAIAIASSAQTLTTLVNFDYTNGAEPLYEPLVQGPDGNFYGTTNGAGTHNGGIVFKMTPSGTVTVLYSFCSQPNCTDGNAPDAGLALGHDGNFYGVTTSGGANGDGAVFSITPSGSYTLLHSFTGSDGAEPQGTLLLASDGNFYGTATSQGSNHGGTLFRITSGGAFTTVYNFCTLGACHDGSGPFGGLAQGTDGYLYGTTTSGGTGFLYGTVFKITLNGVLTTLHSFDDTDDGKAPFAGLVHGTDGNFYGTTAFGANPACTTGLHGCGTVFRLSGPPPSTTTVTSSPNPSTFGQQVTITATVGPAGPPPPTGAVSFTSNGTAISGCTSVILNSGTAQCATSSLSVGTDRIVATYSGDSNYSGSSGSVVQIVNPVPMALQFIAISPCRIVDTRNANGTFGGPPIPGNNSRSFPLTEGDNPCGIPSSAIAYSVNVTAVPQTTLGYLTIWPTGEGQPIASTLNSLDGRIKANAAIIPAGTPDGSVTVYVTNTTNVVLDINGYFTTSNGSTLAFYALTPCRVADTRNPDGSLGGPYLSGGHERDFPVLQSSCGLPNNAVAYSFNFTVVPKTSAGVAYLTVWPQGQSRPVVSTLNDLTNTVVANAALVPAGTGGGVAAYATNDTDLVIDTNGYFASPGSGGLSFYPLTPCRVIDTRNNGQPFTGELTVPVQTSPCGPPATAEGYVFNATVVPDGQLSFLTLWPDPLPRPTVSTLNAIDGAITSNMAIVPNGDGKTDAFAAGYTQLILDISGYFAP